MANFPQTPSLNDPHVEGGVNWIYDGDKWVKQSPTINTDIHVGVNEPTEKENGTLWFDSSEDTLALLLYYDPDGDPTTAAWIPATPIGVHVGDAAPGAAAKGDLWYNNADPVNKFLSVYVNEVWEKVTKTSSLQNILDNGNVATQGATFGGKVIVQPGTSGNEAITHSQFSELQSEVESIAPALERGSWLYSDGGDTTNATQIPADGKYFLIADRTSAEVAVDANLCSIALLECTSNDPFDSECNRIYTECVNAVLGEGEVITKEFGKTKALVFANTDYKGTTHTWNSVVVGQHIDVFDAADDDFLLGIITAKVVGEDSTRLDIDVVSSQGDDDDTEVRIKVFSVQDGVDVTEFVRKSGDSMTGQLTITGTSTALRLGSTSYGSTFYASDPDGTTIFRVKGDGKVQAGNSESTAFMATAQNDVATKKYVDSQFTHPGMGLRWKYNSGDNPNVGEFAIKGSFSFRIYHTTFDGLDYFRDLCSSDRGTKSISSFLTVYQISSGKYKPYEVFELNKFRFGRNAGQMEFEYSTKVSVNSLTNGSIYYITVGGIF